MPKLHRSSRGANQGHDVALHGFGYSDLLDLGAGGEDRLLGNDRLGWYCTGLLAGLAAYQAHHLQLRGVIGIADHDVQQESVHLSFWQ